MTPAGLAANIKDLVTLPEVAMRISRMVDDPNSSATDIGREISNDVALTAKLLRIANSAAYGQNRQIASVSRAITVMGVKQVRNLTVGLMAIKAFDGISNELMSMEDFWRQSLLCAVAAGQIASTRKLPGVESPFVAGLLHDIGQLVLFSQVSEQARAALLMMADAPDEMSLNLCEINVMGFDHAAVGAELALNWKLPTSLVECIRYHHEPHLAKNHPAEVALVHIANSVATLAEINSMDPADAAPMSAIAVQRVGLDVAQLPELIQLTRTAAAEIMPLLLAA
jgi:HD-like signal output (HDOD) protein